MSHLFVLFVLLTVITPDWGVAIAASGANAGIGVNPVAVASERLEPNELLQRVVSGQISSLDTNQVEEFIAGLEAEMKSYIPKLDLNETIFREGGRLRVDFAGLIQGLLRYFLREVVFNFRLLGQLLVLIVLCTALHQLQVSWDGFHFTDLVIVVSFLAILFISLECFQSALGVASTAIDRMVQFMHVIVPMLSALLAAAGSVTSATVLHPLLLAATVFVGTAIRNLVFPLSIVGLVLGVAGNLSGGMAGSKLAALANKTAGVCLSLLCVGFLGILTVRGALAPLVDGVGLKTAKFLAGKFLPVVGGVFSGAVEVVAGGSMLIKSAVGAFGLFVVTVLAAFPLVKLGSILVIFRVISALVEPITDPRIVKAIDQIGDSLALIFAAVVVTAVMFFLALTIVISIGNLAVMLQ